MKIFCIAIIVFVSSCKESQERSTDECKDALVSNKGLYNTLKEYQKINPIPRFNESSSNSTPPSHTSAFKYIYEVRCFVQKEDSLLILSLKPDGITHSSENPEITKNVYGVYQDSCLLPTYFTGDSNFVKLFVSKLLSNDLSNFYYDNSSIIDIIYVRYIYKFKNGNLFFVAKEKGNSGK